MYQKKITRIISLLLCMVMLLGNIPVVTRAAETDGEVGATMEAVSAGQSAPDIDLPDNGELFAWFAERELYGYDMATYGTAARDNLNAVEQAIYDQLKTKIEAVAVNGGSTVFVLSEVSGLKTSWTNAELGVASIDDTSVVNQAFQNQFNLDSIVIALLNDCPLDFYWYDKTGGMNMGYQVSVSTTSDGVQTIWNASVTNLTFTFAVSADYKSGDYVVTTDVAKITAAKNKAAQVVADNAGKSDQEKLEAYKKFICEAVSYNQAAADDLTMPYGAPWQLIYVFDGDSTTNVVCEGYSKAFQYLCDLTTFSGSTVCYSVSGQMDGGNHMWNIVTLEDNNYLVDVTNSDDGTVGQSGSLFLAGGTGSVAAGYAVAGNQYTYDSETVSCWGESVLTLSNKNYAAGGSTEEDGDLTASGTCGDNLTWTLDDNGKLTISGIGAMYDYPATWVDHGLFYEYISSAPWGDKNVQSVVIEPGVTTIGEGAFYLCTKLENIAIPSTVRSIGQEAFSGFGMTFYSETIKGCVALTEIDIPASVTSIAGDAFVGSGLKKIKFPEGAVITGTFAMTDCKNLMEINIPSSVTSIAGDAFSGCSSLTAISFPEGIPIQGTLDLSGCSSLIRFVIPNGITTIGDVALMATPGFRGCSSLREIVIPHSLTSIEVGAFDGCSSLTDIHVADLATWMQMSYTDCGQVYDTGNGLTQCNGLDKNLYVDGQLVTELVIPEGYTDIGYFMFKDFTFTKVTVPASVRAIGPFAFEDCRRLKAIVIADGVQVGEGTFTGCDNIKEVYFGGTKAQWTAICDNQYSDPPAADYVHYSCTEPEGHWKQESADATCSAAGYTREACVCGYVRNEVTTPTTSHDYKSVVTAPTCTADGYTTHTCSACGDTYQDTPVNKLGHTGGTATCKDKAVCTRCNTAYGELNAGNHVGGTEVRNAKTATCVAEGYTGDTCCLGCGTKIADGKATAKTAHSYTSQVTAPTCTADGYTTYTCSACGHSYQDDTVSKLGHTGGTATCKDKAICTRCNTAYGELNAKNHIGGTEIRNAKAATCAAEGYTGDTYCVGCGSKIAEGKAIAKAAHTYTSIVTAPTCTADGYTTHICSVCGDIYQDTPVNKLGHSFSNWAVSKEATPFGDGEEIRKCSRCDHSEKRAVAYTGNALKLTDKNLAAQSTVWINGLPYPVKGEGESRYVDLPVNGTYYLVTYSWKVGDAKDIHTQYPTGMKVYKVTKEASGFVAKHIPELDNLLQYSGSSIRITGKKGIRMITSLTKANKEALTGKGLAGFKLEEYGTALCFASELKQDGDLVLGKSYTRSNYAYKKGVADPVFAKTGDLIQYTNVLVGFSLDQCKDDIAMRPYIILSDAQGNKITLYGGTIYRSIGYIAYQNRNVFKPGNGSYDYVWEIIHHVYGKKFDADYKG